MTKEVEELKRQVDDLESELAASMRREELRVNASNGGGSLRQKIKNKIKSTRLWRAADDPNDKLGKLIRSPRTIVRIVTNPSVVREIREKNAHTKNDKGSNKDVFSPVRFFFAESGQKRVNVVFREIDLELINMGILLANKEDIELRIVSMGVNVDGMWYRKMIKDGKLAKSNNVSFYNTVEQNVRAKIFELEVSKNDIFLTRAWNDDEKN